MEKKIFGILAIVMFGLFVSLMVIDTFKSLLYGSVVTLDDLYSLVYFGLLTIILLKLRGEDES